MSRNERVLKLVKSWANAIGHIEAKKRLINRNVAVSTSDKIVRSDYQSIPGDMITAVLLEEMEKDGFVLTDEAI